MFTAARNREIVRRLVAGDSVTAIVEQYRISETRVGQIMNAAGYFRKWRWEKGRL